MIAKLIEEYTKAGGKRPYALVLPVGVYADMPVDVFCVWTPMIVGRVIVLPLAAAAALLNEAMQLIVESEVKEEKATDE